MKKPITKGMSNELNVALRQVQRELHLAEDLRAAERGRLGAEYAQTAMTVAARMGMKAPGVVSMRNDVADAYAYRSNGLSSVSISVSTARALKGEDRAVVMAHELSHIKHNDGGRTAAVYKFRQRASNVAAAAAFSAGSVAGHVFGLHGAADIGVYEGMMAASAVGVKHITRASLQPVISVISRIAERRADRASLMVAGPIATIKMQAMNMRGGLSALDRLLDGNRAGEAEKEKASLAARLGYVQEKVRRFMYATHPSTEARIKSAIKYAKKYGIRDEQTGANS